jgi:hypothetical protein
MSPLSHGNTRKFLDDSSADGTACCRTGEKQTEKELPIPGGVGVGGWEGGWRAGGGDTGLHPCLARYTLTPSRPRETWKSTLPERNETGVTSPEITPDTAVRMWKDIELTVCMVKTTSIRHRESLGVGGGGSATSPHRKHGRNTHSTTEWSHVAHGPALRPPQADQHVYRRVRRGGVGISGQRSGQGHIRV